MNEIKRPRKPLMFYYAIVLLVLVLFNALLAPLLFSPSVTDVDYGTFMSMTENGETGSVQIQSNQILFTDKAEEQIP